MPEDVRMRGFRSRASVAEAIAWLDARPLAPVAETIDVAAAAGRVLAAPIESTVDVPAFRRAAMDGWALRGAETFGATPGDPLALDVVGVSLPGAPFGGTLAPGQAIRIMTGAPVPDAADAVLRAEDADEADGVLSVREPVAPARHVAAIGEDVRAGSTLLDAGRCLRPQDVAIAASVGHGALPVWRRPHVTILATGDELVAPGTRPDGVRIVDSNTPMLRALVARDGGAVAAHVHVPDGEASVRDALEGADGDVVLVSGGSSVGQEDHAPRLVAALGTLAFHGIAMRPASPSGMGTLGDRHVFLLPGNPVSCLSAYDTFAARIVRRLGGLAPAAPYETIEAPLAAPVTSVLGRQDYVRCTFDGDAVTPLMTSGASLLSSVVRADGFLWVAPESEGHPAGAVVTLHRYR